MQRLGSATTGRAGVHQVGFTIESDLNWIFREQSIEDYGIDAHIEIVAGESPTGKLLAIQIKSGASVFDSPTDSGWWYYLKPDHVEYWMKHSLPVAIVLADVDNRSAYWELVDSDSLQRTSGKGWKILVPRSNVLDTDSRLRLAEAAKADATWLLSGEKSEIGTFPKVPATDAELHLLLRDRPNGWEILAFAGVIGLGRAKLASERRDHRLGYARANGTRLDSQQALARVRELDRDIGRIEKSFAKVLDPAATRAAFGEPLGEESAPVPGDADSIAHIGERLVDVYSQLLELAADLRGLSVPSELDNAFEIAARLTDKPLDNLDSFIDSYIATAESIPAKIATGENVNIELVAPLHFSDEVLGELVAELRRVGALG
nr:DUF4365 domain-containing protein [Nocardia salmonicida]